MKKRGRPSTHSRFIRHFNAAQHQFDGDGYVKYVIETLSQEEEELSGVLAAFSVFAITCKNQLTTVPSSLVSRMVNLTHLNICFNPNITRLDDDLFSALPNLLILDARRNGLQMIPTSLKTCKKLHTLRLEQNQIKAIPFLLCDELPMVTHFRGAYNPFYMCTLQRYDPQLDPVFVASVIGLEDRSRMRLVDIRTVARVRCYKAVIMLLMIRWHRRQEMRLGLLDKDVFRKIGAMVYESRDDFVWNTESERNFFTWEIGSATM